MYVLPWGQIGLILYIISVYSFTTPKLKGESRIGPHPEDVISIIPTSLVGDAYAERRGFLVKNIKTLGGTRISFHQSEKNLDYLMWLWNRPGGSRLY